MGDKYIISKTISYLALLLCSIGLLTFIIGLITQTQRTWANFLLNDYYFLSITIGATFFLAIQYITQSGWSSLFLKIPHAFGRYLPFSAILTLLLIFGMNSIYHWSIPDVAAHDPLIEHKSPYLNIPFFFVRIAVFFALWIFMTNLLRITSRNENIKGGKDYFRKSEMYSRVYIFILAVTFSLFSFDLIMSIDVHWFSTVFAVKNFISGFLHGIAVIVLVVILLSQKGYYKHLNKDHLHDFSKYIFILSIIWAYLWFVQYMLIWFGNIQEETIYYIVRTEGKWKVLFFLNLILNWVIPFIILLSNKFKESKFVIMIICGILIIGQWVDLYLQIMPGIMGEPKIGFVEIGIFAGFLGLFIWVISRALSKDELIPWNHPYIEESIHHEL